MMYSWSCYGYDTHDVSHVSSSNLDSFSWSGLDVYIACTSYSNDKDFSMCREVNK